MLHRENYEGWRISIRHAVNFTFHDLTLYACSIASVVWSNSVLNSSEVEQSAAELWRLKDCNSASRTVYVRHLGFDRKQIFTILPPTRTHKAPEYRILTLLNKFLAGFWGNFVAWSSHSWKKQPIAKCMGQFYEFILLRSNLRYTFDGTALSRVGD